ncbi:MAG: N-acetylglucosamine kinase [Bythopirellula sp.]
MTNSSSVGPSDSQPIENLPLLLGVDGGGTKTLAWVAQVDQQGTEAVLGEGYAGSSNQLAVGVEAALDNLAEAIEKACDHARLSPNQIAAAVFALAGAGDEGARQRVLKFAKQRFHIPSAQVIHDGQAVLEAATPDGWGLALIAGTGAVAFGKNQQGETAVVGGWGYWFGDEGSAYWLGQAALRAIAQATDGRGPDTLLSEKVLDRLELTNPRGILAELLEQGDTRLAIADLADLVCEAAEQNDAVANSLLDEATHHWIQHLTCLADQLGMDRPLRIALAGGVFAGSQLARDRFTERLVEQQLSTEPNELVRVPVLGCVLLASRLSS